MAIVLQNGNTKHLPPSVEGGGPRSGGGRVLKQTKLCRDRRLDCPLQHKSYFCVEKGNSLRHFLAKMPPPCRREAKVSLIVERGVVGAAPYEMDIFPSLNDSRVGCVLR